MALSARNDQLGHLLEHRKTLVAPGAFDALSAKLIEETGFEVVYIGSYGTSASGFGLPDVGLLSLDDLCGYAKRVVDAVKVPVIADAEGGFHDPANIWRTVRAFEESGVSAIHIEDHAGGKHAEVPQHLIPLDQMLAKLRAAMEARRSPNFRIIARTDAIWAMGDSNEAARRVKAFTELGVDMVFPTGAKIDFVKSIRKEQAPKVVVIETPSSEPFAKAEAADLVIYYGFCLYAAAKGMLQALRSFRKDRDSSNIKNEFEDVLEFEKRFDYQSFAERTKRYSANPE
jgi:methylisocitrate lyase